MEHPTSSDPSTDARALPARPEQSNLRGIFWMLVTGFCFLAVTASVKLVGPDVPPTQAAFLRYALALPFLIPMLASVRRTPLNRQEGGLLALRGLSHSVAVSLWFLAMTRIPIADVTALNYLTQVYVILLAVVFLGERIGPWRVVAVLVAFLGTFVIVRPGFDTVDTGHLVMLAAAVFMAISYVTAKHLSARLPAEVIVFYLSIMVPLILLPTVIPVWAPVGLRDLVLLGGCALFATLGHFTMTLAFRSAPLSVTQPISFLQLVWATLLGALFFAEPVDIFVVAGGGMIIASISFIAWRETRSRPAK